jgi:hypothetical protein
VYCSVKRPVRDAGNANSSYVCWCPDISPIKIPLDKIHVDDVISALQFTLKTFYRVLTGFRTMGRVGVRIIAYRVSN